MICQEDAVPSCIISSDCCIDQSRNVCSGLPVRKNQTETDRVVILSHCRDSLPPHPGPHITKPLCVKWMFWARGLESLVLCRDGS